ncbi:MAG: hypothetical protein M1827_003094 [Pycnora praestabilis]|nr:MAG: hypothetical protein M1827_003094 [Pycnora praestabilis]
MGSVVISDVVSDIARFPHTMLAGNATQQSAAESIYRTSSSSHSSQANPTQPPPAPAAAPVATPQSNAAPRPAATTTPSTTSQYQIPHERPIHPIPTSNAQTNNPSFVYNQAPTRQPFASQQYIPQPPHSADLRMQTAGSHDSPRNSNTGLPRGVALSSSSAQSSPTGLLARSLSDTPFSGPNCIKVRDLSHIQSFASDEFLQTRTPPRSRHDTNDVGLKYEISAMPVTDIIEMVAGLLTKITTTNDRQHEHLHRHIPPLEGTSGMSQQTTSVLAFHGKNVPSITILSYLSRIHKYCPTTYEVFLSLLVYFDRMTERVNSGPMQNLRQANNTWAEEGRSRSQQGPGGTPSSTSVPAGWANPADRSSAPRPTSGSASSHDHHGVPYSPTPSTDSLIDADPYNVSHFFVVDSFNIHRLVIAGVTCASKFFSDVFYTNSRYAKVGGLPLIELNHLELQFLLLNDFRLSVPVEELEAYGTMLVEFYAREVMAERNGGHAMEGSLYQGAGIQTPTPP